MNTENSAPTTYAPPKHSSFAPPRHTELWPAYLGFLFDHPNHVTEVKIEIRSDTRVCHFYIRQAGPATVHLCSMDFDQAGRLFALLIPEAAALEYPMSFFTNAAGFLQVELNKIGAKLTGLPCYPNGYDISISSRSMALSFHTLSSFQFPFAVLNDLLGLVGSSSSGIFAITGTVGTGKTSLSCALLRHLDDTSSSDHVRQLDVNDQGPGVAFDFGSRISDLVDDDLMVWAEFSGYNGSASGVVKRFEDFNIPPTHIQKTVGWVSPRLVPILCTDCCKNGGQGDPGRKRGPGCQTCFGVGFSHSQMVLDIWKYNPSLQKGELLQSACVQAMTLAQKGLAEWGFVDNLFGDAQMRQKQLTAHGWLIDQGGCQNDA